MAVTRVQYPPRKTTRQKMREDTKAGKRESSDSIPGRSKDATRAAVDKRRVERKGSYKTRMDDPAPIKPSSMPKSSPLPPNIRRVEMKAGGMCRGNGIAQRGQGRINLR